MIPEEIQISQSESVKILKVPGNTLENTNWVSFVDSTEENPEQKAIYINSDNSTIIQMQGLMHRLMEMGCKFIEREDLLEDDLTMGRLATYLIAVINNNNLNFNASE